MRKEKLKELKEYMKELSTIKKIKEPEEYSYDEKGNPIKPKNFINIEKYNCILRNGMMIPREKIVKNGKTGSAAIILPITEENNTLLVVQPRVFTKETVCVELPAGYIEDGESPLEAGNWICSNRNESTC